MSDVSNTVSTAIFNASCAFSFIRSAVMYLLGHWFLSQHPHVYLVRVMDREVIIEKK